MGLQSSPPPVDIHTLGRLKGLRWLHQIPVQCVSRPFSPSPTLPPGQATWPEADSQEPPIFGHRISWLQTPTRLRPQGEPGNHTSSKLTPRLRASTNEKVQAGHLSVITLKAALERASTLQEVGQVMLWQLRERHQGPGQVEVARLPRTAHPGEAPTGQLWVCSRVPPASL